MMNDQQQHAHYQPEQGETPVLQIVHLDGEMIRLQAYLRLLQQHRERLMPYTNQLRRAFTPFQDREPVSSEHCHRALRAVEAVEAELQALASLLMQQREEGLPVVAGWLRYPVLAPVYSALEWVQETCMSLVLYRHADPSPEIKLLQRYQPVQLQAGLLQALRKIVTALSQMEQRAIPAYERLCRQVQQRQGAEQEARQAPIS